MKQRPIIQNFKYYLYRSSQYIILDLDLLTQYLEYETKRGNAGIPFTKLKTYEMVHTSHLRLPKRQKKLIAKII